MTPESLLRPSIGSICEHLERLHQRATYGAVAGLVSKTPRTVMQGLPRNWRHSWVVNQDDGEPSEYHELQKHPALRERGEVISSSEDLALWLNNPR